MKKPLLTLTMLLPLAAIAQTKDTTVSFRKNELIQISSNIQNALMKIHSVHLDALKRDSIDAYLLNVQQFLDRKYAVKLDSLKKKGGKGK